MTSEKTACITGGTRGIGFGIACALAKQGWNLVLCGRRNESRVTPALKSLQEHTQKVHYIQADMGTPAGRTTLMDTMQARVATLHLLVNNAGIAPPVRADLLETTEESYSRVMDINLLAPFFLTQACARWMIPEKKKHPEDFFSIVNISSVSATVASVSRGEYCISKAGMAMLTRLFAVRLGEFDIPVYEIRPGVTRTDMTSSVKEKYDTLIAQGLCIQPRWGTPDDVGRAVSMLASGALPYSTGQVIDVDGGLTVQRL